MALKVLRGTTAQRTGYTPEVGEPVWDTDTSKLYVGDGTTPGGVAVDIANNELALNDLTDVTVLAPPVGGQGLIYDAGNTAFVPGDPTKLDDKSIDALSDVDLSTPATVGQVLKWDGSKFVPGDDNSVAGTGLVEGATYPISIDGTTFGDVYTEDGGTQIINGTTGRIIADVYNAVEDAKIIDSSDGSLAGSLYTADRTKLIFDSTSDTIDIDNIVTNVITPGLADEPIFINNSNRIPLQITSVSTGSLGGFSYVDFNSVKGSLETPTDLVAGDYIGGWKISSYKTGLNGTLNAVVASARFDSSANMADTNPSSSFNVITNAGGTGINIFSMDHIGQFVAPGPVTPGTYADATARDAAITSPVAGMIVFVTDVAKHQGYDGTSWNNLY